MPGAKREPRVPPGLLGRVLWGGIVVDDIRQRFAHASLANAQRVTDRRWTRDAWLVRL